MARQQPYADFFQKSFFSRAFQDPGQIYIRRWQSALNAVQPNK